MLNTNKNAYKANTVALRRFGKGVCARLIGVREENIDNMTDTLKTKSVFKKFTVLQLRVPRRGEKMGGL